MGVHLICDVFTLLHASDAQRDTYVAFRYLVTSLILKFSNCKFRVLYICSSIIDCIYGGCVTSNADFQNVRCARFLFLNMLT